ncbi:arsenate reductase (glutaredoxin) [Sulfitobacter aestuarii]|uniref:Arsenate reductase n=1 Tax=Sulfitobacter aestuarii TaxID=2161676 RepID=A0ABW5U4Y4_9RHOB
MITLWHNPRCSKSRQTLALLDAAGAEVTLRRYLEDAPSLTELRAAQEALDLPVIAMMRQGEARFRELGLSATSNEDALLRAMAENPSLIERPIAFRDGRAVIGRPPEAVNALF